MTAEQFLELPCDGIDRWLIQGVLREGGDISLHSRRPCRARTHAIHVLADWLQLQPEPRGELGTRDLCFRISHHPDTIVCIDLAYFSADLVAKTADDAPYVDGSPTLALEILSPSNTHENVSEKINNYLRYGVPLVWKLDPDFKTVTVYRPGEEPVLFNRLQELSGEPQLPGFRVAVAELF